MVPTPPADWYPDPQQPARLRYWDGAAWTGYLVDPDKPGVVRYENPPWAPNADVTAIDSGTLIPLAFGAHGGFSYRTTPGLSGSTR